MKRNLSIFIFFVLLAVYNAEACTNFLVGREASADGSTMVSYAADSYALYGFLHYAPAADHPAGAIREVRDWDTGKPLLSIPEVAHTYRVVGNTNEHQLTIGETTWGGREELWDTAGIDYGSLMYIALERCKTAREAIACMTSLVAEYGYASEGETFSIADPHEVWIMDMVGKGPGGHGAVWVAARVPDDCICAHANQARITKIDWKDKKNWMWSKDLVSFAREKGYFTGKKDADFSFQEAYAPYDFSGLYVCEARVWSFFRRFSDDMDRYFDYATGKTFVETKGQDCGERMPLWIRPNHKVTAHELKACMRDQYEGTPLDITQGTDAGPWNTKLRYGSLTFTLDSVAYWYERPTATQQTGWSYVAQMHKNKPFGVVWFGVDDARTNLYVPLFTCLREVPECLREDNGDMYTYSPTAAWWVFNEVANRVYPKYSAMIGDVMRAQQMWEDKWEDQLPGLEAKAATMPANEAEEMLSNYSIAQAEQSTAAWRELGTYLLVKYLDGQQRKEENGAFLRNAWGMPEGPERPAFPETFLRKIAPEIAHE